MYERLVELLIDAGATVDQRDDRGCTPLRYAMQSSHPTIARLLQEAGADPQ